MHPRCRSDDPFGESPPSSGPPRWRPKDHLTPLVLTASALRMHRVTAVEFPSSCKRRGRQLIRGVARTDSDTGAFEVDVTPTEPEKLTAPQSSECGRKVDRPVPGQRPPLERGSKPSSGENTSMSPLRRVRKRSTFATGLRGSCHTLTARRMIACISTSCSFCLVRDRDPRPSACHASTPPFNLSLVDVRELHRSGCRQQVRVQLGTVSPNWSMACNAGPRPRNAGTPLPLQRRLPV